MHLNIILWVVQFHWSEFCFFAESCVGKLLPTPFPLHFYIRVIEPFRISLNFFLSLFLGETAMYKPVKSERLLYHVLSAESQYIFLAVITVSYSCKKYKVSEKQDSCEMNSYNMPVLLQIMDCSTLKRSVFTSSSLLKVVSASVP